MHKAHRIPSLENLTVISFESRRAKELAELVRRYGGNVLVAPSMREKPLAENRSALEFFRKLEKGRVDVLILLTGVGTRALVSVVTTEFPRERLTAALRRITLVARGPKPAAALRELGLSPGIAAPEPNTWRELLSELDRKTFIRGRSVAVQEYGAPRPELIAALESRGAQVLRVPVYRWALPEDTGPLRRAIRTILEEGADVVLFTNATQVAHLFKLAREERKDASLRRKMRRVLIASIGPICTEALASYGLEADLEPSHPKMGHLVSVLAEQGRALLARKRSGSSPGR